MSEKMTSQNKLTEFKSGPYNKPLYCMHYMILMSKKMTSQKKLGEIKLVPYNKPLSKTFQKITGAALSVAAAAAAKRTAAP